MASCASVRDGLAEHVAPLLHNEDGGRKMASQLKAALLSVTGSAAYTRVPIVEGEEEERVEVPGGRHGSPSTRRRSRACSLCAAGLLGGAKRQQTRMMQYM